MKRNNKKGSTLLEILFSTVLIAIVSIIFFSCLVTSYSYLERLMEMRTATLILQEQISKTREVAFADIPNIPDLDNDKEGIQFESTLMADLNGAEGTITMAQYGNHNETLKITVTVTWTAYDGSSASRSLSTLITDHGINKR